MNEVKNATGREALLAAIRDSIEDARNAVQSLYQALGISVRSLRLEQNEAVFTAMVQNIRDLQCLLDFIKELQGGIRFFDNFGLPPDPVSSRNFASALFEEMNTAFTVSDWVMISDLIEYELSPLLADEDRWLGQLQERLTGYELPGMPYVKG